MTQTDGLAYPPKKSSLSNALSLLTATSLLSPLAGLVVAPILTHAFDPVRRGILAAAITPSTLILSVATLGLPEALTYFSARLHWQARSLFLRAALLTVLFGVLCLSIVFVSAPALSKHDNQLENLILVAALIIIPALVVNLLRGAATGLHAWQAIAIERVALAALRILLFGGLFLTNRLSLQLAVVATAIIPTIAGLVYLRVVLGRKNLTPEPSPGSKNAIRTPEMLRYGLKVWMGSVAGILLARVDQLLLTPLSGAGQLGLYAVSVTISELPAVVGGAVQAALFGFSSRERDAAKLALAGRIFFIIAFGGCLIISISLPFWIGFIFGNDYREAIWPSILLIIAALIIVPANSAGTALNAWGRPGLRSLILALTLVVNLAALFLLVPWVGIYGACYANIIGNLVLASSVLLFAKRITGLDINAFVVPRKGDFILLHRFAIKKFKSVRAHWGGA